MAGLRSRPGSRDTGCAEFSQGASGGGRRAAGVVADGSYWLELPQSDGQPPVVSVPASEAAVLKHFQAWMPYGLVVPDVRLLLFFG